MIPTSPEIAKGWIDLAVSYGPVGIIVILLFLYLIASKVFGFSFVNARKAASAEPVPSVERRAPVQIECPVNPTMNAMKTTLEQLVRQHERMLEIQIEANTHLEHLVDLHLPPRERSGTHSRIKREEVAASGG